jgi:hypothetical protein
MGAKKVKILCLPIPGDFQNRGLRWPHATDVQINSNALKNRRFSPF